MRCKNCSDTVVMHSLCKKHFVAGFEQRVKETITQHKLIRKKDRVVVAASGGKDSTTLLFVLKKLGFDVSALAIDEGIAGYRDQTLQELKKFCKEKGITLKIVSFKDEYGKKLDKILKDKKLYPCSVCGTFRRQLMNRHAATFDVIATGHNADDEAQAVLMNLTRANTDLFPRGGPVTTSNAKGFVKRVKPLYFCTEKEIMTYALLNNIASEWTECPYITQAYRATVRDALNDFEAKHPGTKQNILRHYLTVKQQLPVQESAATACTQCGEPSAAGECKACRIAASL